MEVCGINVAKVDGQWILTGEAMATLMPVSDDGARYLFTRFAQMMTGTRRNVYNACKKPALVAVFDSKIEALDVDGDSLHVITENSAAVIPLPHAALIEEMEEDERS